MRSLGDWLLGGERGPLDSRDTYGGDNGVGKTNRAVEPGDEALNGPAVSPASETWAPYYAAAAKETAERETRRLHHVATARTAMRVLLFVAAAIAAICYVAFADR